MCVNKLRYCKHYYYLYYIHLCYCYSTLIYFVVTFIEYLQYPKKLVKRYLAKFKNKIWIFLVYIVYYVLVKLIQGKRLGFKTSLFTCTLKSCITNFIPGIFTLCPIYWTQIRHIHFFTRFTWIYYSQIGYRFLDLLLNLFSL